MVGSDLYRVLLQLPTVTVVALLGQRGAVVQFGTTAVPDALLKCLVHQGLHKEEYVLLFGQDIFMGQKVQ